MKKQNTKNVDIFAGKGSTADKIKERREQQRKELERITGIKQTKR